MNLLSVASEVFPLVKTGGLADVAGALPVALTALGIRTRALLPGYPAVLGKLVDPESVFTFDELAGGGARLLAASVGALDLFVLDAPHLYARDGGLYGWPDDAQRFAALARVGAMIGFGLIPDFVPDVIHAHDWQAGLVPAYLRYDGRTPPGTVMTVHNLAFQGQFPAELLGALGLPDHAMGVDGVEYYGGIGFLKAGLRLADRITTVSPTYALEICTPELGMGLDGLLRERAQVLSGILNGIDDAVWNPANDKLIAACYDARTSFARLRNKAALQERMGLPHDPSTMLLAVISRMSWQKGIDLIIECIPAVIELGAQLAILGAGDDAFEAAARAAADANPGQVGCIIGYDETLAHLMQAGADAVLVPSRFEPCGLTQLCALRYGAVPVVAHTGGLVDTVIDANPMAVAAGVATGIQFAPVNAEMLRAALRRAATLFRNGEAWRRMQHNGMRGDVSWRESARQYAALYREVAR